MRALKKAEASSPIVAVGGHEAEVGVEARGLVVVVAGAEVHVAPDAVLRAPHHQADLGVGLVAADAVDDVGPRLLQAARPADVRLLVEAGHQLHEDRDLLALLGGAHQRLHHRRVAARAVERLLDGQHVGVVGGPGEEGHHRLERLVGVVEEDVALLQELEEPLHLGRLQHGQRLQGRRRAGPRARAAPRGRRGRAGRGGRESR